MTTARLSTTDFRARDGMVVTPLGTFEPGEVYVTMNSGAWREPQRLLLARRATGETVAVLGEYPSIEARIEDWQRLGRALVGAETRALAQRAVEARLPLAAYMWPANWREPYPEPEDVLRLWGLDPAEWDGWELGGRSPVVLAVPKRGPQPETEWRMIYLSHSGAVDACHAGFPVIARSVHGAWKLVKRQGAIIELVELDGDRYGATVGHWRPGYVPTWHWGGRSRRWWPSNGEFRGDALWCGDYAAEPEGRIETPGGDEA